MKRLNSIVMMCIVTALISLTGCSKSATPADEDPVSKGNPGLIRVRLGSPGDRPTPRQFDIGYEFATELLCQRTPLSKAEMRDTTDRSEVFPRVTADYALRGVFITGIGRLPNKEEIPWRVFVTFHGEKPDWDSIEVGGSKPIFIRKDGREDISE